MKLTKHHKRCRSWRVENNDDFSFVTKKQHQAWHILFSNMKPETIALIINDKWIPSNYKFICEKERK